MQLLISMGGNCVVNRTRKLAQDEEQTQATPANGRPFNYLSLTTEGTENTEVKAQSAQFVLWGDCRS